MTTYNTLLLDTVAWDLVLDSFGNIALASPPYALAQDVASAIRTFLGEVYYDASLGVPYFQDILGQLPPMALFIAKIEAAVALLSSNLSKNPDNQANFRKSTTGMSQAKMRLLKTIVLN